MLLKTMKHLGLHLNQEKRIALSLKDSNTKRHQLRHLLLLHVKRHQDKRLLLKDLHNRKTTGQVAVSVDNAVN